MIKATAIKEGFENSPVSCAKVSIERIELKDEVSSSASSAESLALRAGE